MSDKTSKVGFLKDALDKRTQEHRLRSLSVIDPEYGSTQIRVNGKKYVNFSSNDYLGLSTHPELIKRSNDFASRYGVGAGASRLVTGTFNIHENLETKIAQAFGTEAAILFNSGFQANTSILSATADRNSLILADKNIHNLAEQR